MVDVFDDMRSEDAPASGGKLRSWVEGVISGLGFVPWLLLGLGGGAVFAAVSAARTVARSQPQLGGPLAPLAAVGAVLYATMVFGLTVGGVAFQRRREWARRLLVSLASGYRPAWLAVLVWCLMLMARLALHYHGHRWQVVAEDITQGLAMAAVGALALSVYMASIRQALRRPAIIAACAGASAFAEALRARDEWASALLSPRAAPAAQGRYPDPPSRLLVVMTRARLAVGMVVIALGVLALSLRSAEGRAGWSVAWGVWGAWSAGGVLYGALRQVVGVSWDEEEVVLRRLFGMPVRMPWSALHRIELELPPEPRPDGSTPPFPVHLFLQRGRPFRMVMKPDTDAGRSFLTTLLHRAGGTA